MVNNNGIESSTCKTTNLALLSSAEMITINKNFAYIVNFNTNNYTQCLVGTSGIKSATCANITPVSPGALSNPFGITFN